MTKYEVLHQIESKKLSPKKAYEMIYKKPKERKPRRASFIKASIRIPDQKGVNLLLSVLLILPLPIFIIRWVMKKRQNIKISDDLEIGANELISLIAVKGVKILVTTKTRERISLRTI